VFGHRDLRARPGRAGGPCADAGSTRRRTPPPSSPRRRSLGGRISHAPQPPRQDRRHRRPGLVLAGVDTFRLNFSHGTQDDHARVHGAIRALERETGRPIGILQDLQGPKIRLGTLAGGRLDVAPGETLRFVLEGAEGDRNAIPLPHREIFLAVAPGQDLLIDDGRVRVRVTGLTGDSLEAEVITGGTLSNRKGVNLPGTLLLRRRIGPTSPSGSNSGWTGSRSPSCRSRAT
jgi:hypothetical protein